MRLKQTFLASLVTSVVISAPVWAESTQQKITKLESLIKQADAKGLDASREEMALHTSKLFLHWADLDEKNVEKHIPFLKHHRIYKKQAKQIAQELPDLERQGVAKILDDSIAELSKVNAGEIVRKPVPNVDFKDVYIKNGQFTIEGKPVFIADYTWKHKLPELTKYYGHLESKFIGPGFLTNEQGDYQRYQISLLKENKDQIGQVFVSHNHMPKWAKKSYPEMFNSPANRHYAGYDMDHPKAKELYAKLFAATVPVLKGNRAIDLGYMIYNEPSFPVQKGVWNTGGVSDYTIAKFRTWLEAKHGSIDNLNKLWKTSFADFASVTVELPMKPRFAGSPRWYDFMRFNQVRVTAWHQFLNDEIDKYDPEAKTHIKLMPWLWNQSKRSHGMDFEALVEQGDIIGFDAQAQYSHVRGEKMPFMPKYSFDWQSALMTFDFFTSIKPNQVLWDSENHFFTAVSFMEKEVDPAYVNAIYWMAATHGLSGTSTWVWGRDEEGNVIKRKRGGAEYILDVTHQPKGLHAITRTFMDLNANADDVVKLQHARKPIRVFYSETDTINRAKGMDAIRETYDSLYFEGMPLGFATKNILTQQDPSNWNVVVVQNVLRVTTAEIAALQSYLDAGGTVLIDAMSLKKDEYARPHSTHLTASKGTLIRFNGEKDLQAKTRQLAQQQQFASTIELQEKGEHPFKTVAWRVAQRDANTYVVSVINTGKNAIDINLGATGKTAVVKDLFTGQTIANELSLSVRDRRFLEVTVK